MHHLLTCDIEVQLCQHSAAHSVALDDAGKKTELQQRLAQARQEQGSLSQWQMQAPPPPSWADFTADEIRKQLQLRGLISTGLKPALLERITEAAGPHVELLEYSPDAVAAAKQQQSDPAETVTEDASEADADVGLPPLAIEGQPAVEQMPTDATDLSSYK